jgi:hypothetical protein
MTACHRGHVLSFMQRLCCAIAFHSLSPLFLISDIYAWLCSPAGSVCIDAIAFAVAGVWTVLHVHRAGVVGGCC